MAEACRTRVAFGPWDLAAQSGELTRFFALQEFACNGTLVDDEEAGQVIQLQGDQRQKIKALLTEEGIAANTIKVHGF